MPSAQILISNTILQCKEPGHLGSRAEQETGKDETEASHRARSKEVLHSSNDGDTSTRDT